MAERFDNEGWLDALGNLAAQRGDNARTVQRAAGICRQLRISPWIALGIAEGRVAMADVAVLDRADRCKDLQAAVLEKGRPLDELRALFPYAPYLLAAEIMERLGADDWRMSDALEVARGLLEAGRTMTADGLLAPLQLRPVAEYVRDAQAILRLRQAERLDLASAIEVHVGRMDVRVARRLVQMVRLDADARLRRVRSRPGPPRRERRPGGPGRG